jgi:hypothetical protein
MTFLLISCYNFLQSKLRKAAKRTGTIAISPMRIMVIEFFSQQVLSAGVQSKLSLVRISVIPSARIRKYCQLAYQRSFFTTISSAKGVQNGRLHAPVPDPYELLYTLPHKHWNDTGMTAIPRKYIMDAKSQKQAVIVDLETFNRMESIIEDNGLAKFMEEAEEDETLSVHEAKKHYRSLIKD